MIRTITGTTPNGGIRMDIIQEKDNIIIKEYDEHNNVIFATLGKVNNE